MVVSNFTTLATKIRAYESGGAILIFAPMMPLLMGLSAAAVEYATGRNLTLGTRREGPLATPSRSWEGPLSAATYDRNE